MRLSEIPHSKIEDGVKRLLLDSDKGIGVLIDYQRFFLRPLEKEGFDASAILDVIRGLAGRGYFEPYNRGDTSLAELKLTQKGRDEWLREIEGLKLGPSIQISKSQLHFGSGDNIGRDKTKKVERISKKWFEKPLGIVVLGVISTIIVAITSWLFGRN